MCSTKLDPSMLDQLNPKLFNGSQMIQLKLKTKTKTKTKTKKKGIITVCHCLIVEAVSLKKLPVILQKKKKKRIFLEIRYIFKNSLLR